MVAQNFCFNFSRHVGFFEKLFLKVLLCLCPGTSLYMKFFYFVASLLSPRNTGFPPTNLHIIGSLERSCLGMKSNLFKLAKHAHANFQLSSLYTHPDGVRHIFEENFGIFQENSLANSEKIPNPSTQFYT
jgi:hypothetical protein